MNTGWALSSARPCQTYPGPGINIDATYLVEVERDPEFDRPTATK